MKKSGFNFAGLVVAAAVVVFMAGWRLWAVSQKTAHLWEIGTEVGSVAELRYPFAVSSHDGNRLLVAMDAETGPGILFYDSTTGARRWLYEENQKGYVWTQYKVFGWSPDDRFLVFCHQTGPHTEEHQRITGDLFIADGATGATLATIRNVSDATNTLSQFAWLSPNAFAWLTAKQDLLVYEQQGSNWLNTRTFTNATGGGINEAQALTAMSPTSVTWRMREAIWTFDFAAGKAVKAWGTIKNNTTTNTLLDSFFSRDMGKFLLTCRNGTNRFLYTFDPADNSLTEFDAIPRRTPLTGAAWINHGKGYAFLSPEWGIESLSVKTNLASDPVRLLKRGEVRSYTVNGDHLCIVGVMTNEPPGVWDYAVTTGTLRCLLSSATLPLEYTTCVPFEFGMVTNAAGKRFASHLWKPYREEPGKKYPLVLGNTPYSWTPYPMTSGNAGYYFMTVDRPGWDTESLKDWSELVLGLYDKMAKNPHVDTNQVYLYARSIETGPMSKLLSEKPQMWSGAIMFDPGGELPDLKRDYPMKLFIAAGREDKEAVQELGPYQTKAADAGVPAKIVFLNDAPHISYGVAVQRQRIQELAKFLGGEEAR